MIDRPPIMTHPHTGFTPPNIITPPQPGISPPNIKPNMRIPQVDPMREASLEQKPPPILPFDLDFPINTNADEEFDINDFLRLDFADENPSRKRKMNEGYYESSAKRPKRRTRAEIIEDKNRELIRQCKPLYVPLENMFVPSHIRIYGNCEYRNRTVRVHRMKLTPKNEEFHKIKNIGYLRTSNGTAFGCFMGVCRYKTYKKEEFARHLNTYHTIEGNGSKEGYCQTCEKNNCGYSLTDELAHMQSKHIDIPYEATYLILYSNINNELIKKARERRARNRELKEKMTLERTLAMFDELKEPDEIYVPQETVDEGDDDDDYNPESEPESDEEVLDEPEPESEDDIADSASVASSDMESEELEEDEENIPLADTSSDSENEKRRKRSKSKQRVKNEKGGEVHDPNQVPCSQPSQNAVKTDEEEKILIHDIPQYMLQRIKINIENKIDHGTNGPQFTESFTSAIREMLEPEKSESPKNCFARKSTTVGCAKIEPKACSVRVKRLESCESLKKYISEDEGSKEETLPGKKDSIETTKNVMPDIPTPPASEDSRDSMISPPMKAENQSKNLEESIEKISNKILSKISFPSVRTRSRVSESDKETEKSNDKKSSPPLRVSLRQRTKSIAISRTDELYYRDDDSEHCETSITKRRKVGNSALSVFDEKEGIKTPSESVVLPKYSENQVLKGEDDNSTLPNERNEAESTKNPNNVKFGDFQVSNETKKAEDAVQLNEMTQKDEENLNLPPKLEILKIRKDILEHSVDTTANLQKPSANTEKREVQQSQISSQSTVTDSLDVIEIVSSQEEMQTFSNLQPLYPWIDNQVSSTIFKSKKCTDVLLSENCLFSTYKCMKQTCNFFTTSYKAFKTHAEKHDGNHNFCSFCLYDGVSGNDLSEHLKSHDLDRYQCSLCMYRASEKMFVEWHRKKFHPKTNVKICKSPFQKLGVIRRTKMKAEIEQINWTKYVKPYECSSKCRN